MKAARWALLFLCAGQPAAAGGPESALDQAVAALSAQVVQTGVAAPVAVYVYGPAAELNRAAATLLAGRLAGQRLAPVVLSAASPLEAEAQARARGARAVVRVEVAVDGPRLVARGDLVSTWVNFWSGTTGARDEKPAAALTSQVRADPAVLALAAVRGTGATSGPLTMTRALLARFRRPPAALAAADVDGDGRPEVLVLTDEALSVHSLDGAVRSRWALEGWPWSETPCREPFGALSVDPRTRRVAVFSAQRQGPVELAWADGGLKVQGRPSRLVLHGAFEATGVPGQNVLRLEAPARWKDLAPFSTAAFFSAAALQWLLVSPGGAGTWLRGENSTPSRLQPLGVGSTLLDVDGDGQPELLYSDAAPFVERDVLRLATLPAQPEVDLSTLLPRWESEPVEGRVMLAARVDVDQDRVDEALLGIWTASGEGEVHLLRRSAP